PPGGRSPAVPYRSPSPSPAKGTGHDLRPCVTKCTFQRSISGSTPGVLKEAGMGGSFVKGCAVGAVCVLVGGISTLAVAGSGVGGVFNLGVPNSVDAKTSLTGASPSAQLQVTNTNAAGGAFGLGVTSASPSATESVTNTSTGTGLSVVSSNGTGVSA